MPPARREAPMGMGLESVSFPRFGVRGLCTSRKRFEILYSNLYILLFGVVLVERGGAKRSQ